MSLYDKAKVFFSAAAGAGGEGVAYNIKPVEKLKVDEYIENGGFDTDSVWIKNTDAGQEATISGGKGRLVGDGSKFTNLQQNDVFEADKVYKISLEAEIKKGELKVQSNGYDGNIGVISKSGKHSFYFTGISGSPHLVLGRRSPSVEFDIEVDNVSVREVEQKANDFSFVRASDLTATYEGADGLIKKTRENLVEYSNDFSKWSNASGLYGYTLTSGQSGYDGSTNATLVDKTTTDHNGYIYNTATTISHNGVFTYSIYAKDGGDDDSSIHIYIGDNSPKGNIRVNLNTGALLNSTAIATKIEPITGEAGDTDRWYRISFTNDANLNDKPRIQVRNAAGDQNSAGKMFIQNAQIEVGLVPTPYIHRTDSYSKSTAGIREDEPRYDYSLDNDAPPVLMLEPNRQNELPHSEYLDSFTKNTGITLTTNTTDTKSPEGLYNATKVVSTNSNGGFYKSGLNITDDTVNSIYLKGAVGGETCKLKDPGGYGGITNITLTTDWVRYELKSTYSGNEGEQHQGLYVDDIASGSTIYAWGAQKEKGSYATSYIPTYGSAATREGEAHSDLSSFRCELDKPLTKKYTFVVDLRVDNLERPNNNFDDIFAARSKGTIFTDYAFRIESYGSDTDDDDIADTFSLRVFSYKIGDTGSGTTTPHTNGIQLGVRNKIAIVFDEDSGIKIFVNGNSTPMAESTEPGQMHDVHFLEGGGNPRSKTFLYGVQAYDEALSDEECVSLTTIS